MLFNAPAHIRHKLMSAPLSNELAASRGAKALPVRKGDTVRIMRGDNTGFEGKVSRVALNEYRIYIEGLTREKVDGTNIFLPIHPSKVQIRSLNLDDNWRKDVLARKKEIEKPEEEEKPKAMPVRKAEEAPEKPKVKVEEVEEEKPVEALPVEEKVVPEAPKEEAPAEKVPEKVVEAPAKKPAAKKEAVPEKKAPAKEEAAPVVEEKTLAKKAAKPKTARKTAASKKAPAKKAVAKKTAVKPRAKHKASEETEGGQ
jgi:large subunit ribosomal protein L24